MAIETKVQETISPLAGKPAPKDMLVDLALPGARLLREAART